MLLFVVILTLQYLRTMKNLFIYKNSVYYVHFTNIVITDSSVNSVYTHSDVVLLVEFAYFREIQQGGVF